MMKAIIGLVLSCAVGAAPMSVAWAQAKPGSAAPPTVPAGAAPATAAPQDASQPTGASEYVLGPEDVIEFNVLGTSDKVTARIYTDGTVQTNLAGRIHAAGLTTRQLAAELAKALKAGGFYADPTVNVEVVSYASKYVTVLGEFGQPGLVPINRSYHLSEILARVGGVRGEAADYIVVRSEAGPEKRYNVKALASGEASEDPLVNPGDKIFAPPAEKFYISGAVKSPSGYPFHDGMTIAQAIAAAGGLTDSGSDRKVKVRRGNKIITLQADAKVEPGDVLTIGERLF